MKRIIRITGEDAEARENAKECPHGREFGSFDQQTDECDLCIFWRPCGKLAYEKREPEPERIPDEFEEAETPRLLSKEEKERNEQICRNAYPDYDENRKIADFCADEEETFDQARGKSQMVKYEEQLKECFSVGKRNIYRIGAILSKVKNHFLRQGEYGRWLQETFGHEISLRTAYNWRRAYETFPNRPDLFEQFSLQDLLMLSKEDIPDEALMDVMNIRMAGLEERVNQNIMRSAEARQKREEILKRRQLTESVKDVMQATRRMKKMRDIFRDVVRCRQSKAMADYLQRLADEGFVKILEEAVAALSETRTFYEESRAIHLEQQEAA